MGEKSTLRAWQQRAPGEHARVHIKAGGPTVQSSKGGTGTAAHSALPHGLGSSSALVENQLLLLSLHPFLVLASAAQPVHAAARSTAAGLPGGVRLDGMYPDGVHADGGLPDGVRPARVHPTGVHPGGIYPAGIYPAVCSPMANRWRCCTPGLQLPAPKSWLLSEIRSRSLPGPCAPQEAFENQRERCRDEPKLSPSLSLK